LKAIKGDKEMDWLKANWKALVVGLVLGWIAHALVWPMAVTTASAADKGAGGDCCADLEERIAVLEAVTAKKGQKKVTLVVYGQVAKAMTYISSGDYQNTQVTENSNEEAESFVGFKAEANFSPGWKAGAIVEIGVGAFDDGGIGYGPLGGDTNGIYTRRAFVFIGNEKTWGAVSLGLASQATDGVTQTSVANTRVASTMLSIRPIVGPTFGTVVDLWDGNRANVLRYDSPERLGFKLSASWAQANDLMGGSNEGSAWDVALRYADTLGEFQIAAAIGYRDGLVIPSFTNVTDVKVISGSAGIKHITTGVFANVAYGDLDGSELIPGLPHIVGYAAQGGLEQRWNGLGKTTLFGEYALYDLDDIAGAQPTMIGAGLVQAIDGAAMDLYVSLKRYQTDGLLADDVDVGLVGARVKF
jgi:predicted porin